MSAAVAAVAAGHVTRQAVKAAKHWPHKSPALTVRVVGTVRFWCLVRSCSLLLFAGRLERSTQSSVLGLWILEAQILYRYRQSHPLQWAALFALFMPLICFICLFLLACTATNNLISSTFLLRYPQHALDNKSKMVLAPEHEEPMGSWSSEQIRQAVSESVMLTWAPGKAKYVRTAKRCINDYVPVVVLDLCDVETLYDSTGCQYDSSFRFLICLVSLATDLLDTTFPL